MAIYKSIDGQRVLMTPNEEADFIAGLAPISEPRRAVPKSLITQRLIDAGKHSAALAALKADDSAFARWFSPDQPSVYSDNAEVIALLNAIGADPAAILAP